MIPGRQEGKDKGLWWGCEVGMGGARLAWVEPTEQGAKKLEGAEPVGFVGLNKDCSIYSKRDGMPLESHKQRNYVICLFILQ